MQRKTEPSSDGSERAERLAHLSDMILTFICFLLLLTGGKTSSSESHDDQTSSESFSEMPDENAAVYGPSRFYSQESSQSSDEEVCSYQDVLNHLNLTKNKEMYTLSRPVKNYDDPTRILLEMKLSAILDVREVDQTFISHILIHMYWQNDYISWNDEDFCGISEIRVPADSLWKPDLIIEEMIEKDKAIPSPFLTVDSSGYVHFRNDLVVTTSCKMHVYKFPFDVQSCNISFKSVQYSDEEFVIPYFGQKEIVTLWSRETMQVQYEWIFIDMVAFNKTVNCLDLEQTVLVYTIRMKRRSSLYVANFLLPVLFFLCLDFASFLMSDSSGDKIGFKVTVLLAVTVMQLVLNDILPVSSNRIPLIVIFCIGIFALMNLSLLETILVRYLMEKDSVSQDSGSDNDPSLNEMREVKKYASIYREVYDQAPSIDKEDGQLTEIFLAVEKLSDELKKSVTLLSNKPEEGKPGYWTKLAKRINKIFKIFYSIAVSVFLFTIFSVWLSQPD